MPKSMTSFFMSFYLTATLAARIGREKEMTLAHERQNIAWLYCYPRRNALCERLCGVVATD